MSNGNHVRPGEVISSTLINQILDRLDALEQSAPSTPTGPGQVVVFEPQPGAVMHVGDMIHIVGLNFGYSSALQRVTFDETPVSGYAEGSGDHLLRVVVPQIVGLGTGRAAVLSVSNGTSTDTRGVTVLPPAQPLTGTIDIEDRLPEPNPVVAGAGVDYPFILHPRGLNRSAEFTLTAFLTSQTWSTSLRTAGRAELPGGRLPLNPNQAATVYVHISVPTGSNGQAITLALSAVSGTVSGSSVQVNDIVGQAREPSDPDLTLTVGNVLPDRTFVNGEIRLSGGGFNNIPVGIADTAVGGPFRYEVSLQLVPESPSGVVAIGWTFGFLNPATDPPSQPQATTPVGASSVTFAVAVTTDGSTTGRLRLSVRRQGSTVGSNRYFGLVRLS